MGPRAWTVVGLAWILGCVAWAAWQPLRLLPPSGRPLERPWSLFDLAYPLEQNPHRRLLPVRGGLRGVQVLDDGRHAWAVGDGGTVIATADGGASWHVQKTSSGQRLNQVYFVDPLHGWAVGEAGTLLVTRDGGESWQLQDSGTGQSLVDVTFTADGRRGWIAGAAGVLGTADGGATWQVQSGSAQQYVESVHFAAGGQTGVAVGPQVLLSTRDGGHTWVTRETPVDKLVAVHLAPDGRHGWAAGDSGTVVATTDGGASWAVQNTDAATRDPGGDSQGTPSHVLLLSIFFLPDGRTGWAAGGRGTVITTTDGGTTWTRLGALTDATLRGIRFAPDGQHGWAVGDYATVFATDDGGQTWRLETDTTASRSLYSLQFLADGLTGWAVQEPNTVIATHDGGRSWHEQYHAPVNLGSVFFTPGGRKGWTVGADGAVVATRDGGATWAPQASPTASWLESVYFEPDGLRGWAAGRPGSTTAALIATADGGATWRTQDNPATSTLIAIQFQSDGRHGWAVGNEGIVIATADGGAAWKEQSNVAAQPLRALHVRKDAPDGQGQVWAVGDNGTVLATEQGGAPWRTQATPNTRALYGVHFDDDTGGDGRGGWAVGAEGTLLHTADGGATWLARSPLTPADLMSVSFSSARRGWVAGGHGTVLATTDGGATWADPEGAYARGPAPGFWVGLLLGFAALLLGLRAKAPVAGQSSVADAGASDAAVERFQDDALDFAPLARGISRFLRNEQTRAPLTVAITGDWGTGKSSLMRLVEADLRRHGYRPIWFNAWHYQKEDHLFAALLSAIRAKVAPAIGSGMGLAFRARLLWLRSKRRWASALLLTSIAAGLATWLLLHGREAWLWMQDHTSMLHAVKQLLAALQGKESSSADGLAAGGMAALVAWVGAVVALVEGLRRGMTAIGANPAALLAGVTRTFSLKDADAQSSLRARFAQQFSDVTEALLKRPVLMIDDLDRCRPESVLDLVEAVNFLTSSGRCFVIFGMAAERVQAALGIAFERIARELADAELAQTRDESVLAADPAEQEKQKRRAYSRDYLQKLINIEIKVPERPAMDVYRLVTVQGSQEQREVLRNLQSAAAFLPLILAVCAIGLGIWAGASLQARPVSQAAVSTSAAPAPAPTIDTPVPQRAPARPAAGPQPPESIAADAAPLPGVATRAPESGGSLLGWGTLAVLGALVLAGAGVLQRLRQEVIQVNDSVDFRNALALWTPLVSLHRNTPRTLKRFVNWLRYLAMLQQGAQEDRTVGEQILDRLTGRRRKTGVAPEPAVRADALAEPQLIALGALYEVFGSAWRQACGPDDSGEAVLIRHPEHRRLLAELVRTHCERFKSPWPPTPRELEVFARLLTGIRLPASDSEAIRPAAAGASSNWTRASLSSP